MTSNFDKLGNYFIFYPYMKIHIISCPVQKPSYIHLFRHRTSSISSSSTVANMKATLISIASLISAASSFLITDCSSGQITNFSDNKCQIWTAGDFSFQSDSGCTLSAYSEGNCQGSIFTTATQNQCQTAPDGVVSVNCRT
ncbi:hypothetical protein F5B20DRAFT_575862 [Whalleya microplaca]|nr:hypothetical protein F5B20DRAFT_575862 [Whalleya microplaca]